MADYEEKFFVLAVKDIKKNSRNSMLMETTNKLREAIGEYTDLIELTRSAGFGKKFYVCNQDEPYAEVVIKTILAGEEKKLEGKS